LGVQAIGVGTCGALCVGVAFPLLWVIHHRFNLRVDEEAERVGLNISEHKATTEIMDFAHAIQKQTESKDLSLRVNIDGFTETSQIAEHYNTLMDVLEQTTTDVEILQKTESELREAIEQAQAADHAKSEFLANMSHEVRTPLHAILSFANFGKKKLESAPKDKIEAYFDRIETSGSRLLSLVNDLLDLSKLEAGQMVLHREVTDARMIVTGVVDELCSLISERQVDILFERPDDEVMAELDPMRIMQVVRNLMSNAVKFSPLDSTIDVKMLASEHQIHLSVRDHGQGIPPEELETVFDKFVQSSKTKSGAGGTGLGLSISREIVKGHGGRIWAENHPEGGAIFRVELPIHVPANKEELVEQVA